MIVGPNGRSSPDLPGTRRRSSSPSWTSTKVRSARRMFDPVGHYNRPDVFRLAVDTAPHPAVAQMENGFVDD